MEVYECVVCKKMTEGFPATLRRKCLVCRNLELETRYKKNRLEMSSKKELVERHKVLLVFQKLMITKMMRTMFHQPRNIQERKLFTSKRKKLASYPKTIVRQM